MQCPLPACRGCVGNMFGLGSRSRLSSDIRNIDGAGCRGGRQHPCAVFFSRRVIRPRRQSAPLVLLPVIPSPSRLPLPLPLPVLPPVSDGFSLSLPHASFTASPHPPSPPPRAGSRTLPPQHDFPVVSPALGDIGRSVSDIGNRITDIGYRKLNHDGPAPVGPVLPQHR